MPSQTAIDVPEILHTSLPIKPWMSEVTRRLPGIQPLDPSDWIIRDEMYADQMTYRDQLLRDRLDAVYVCDDCANEANREVLESVVASLDNQFDIATNQIRRPDGVLVDMSGPALFVAAQLVQNDLIVLQNIDGDYILTAGVLCFPASWTLQQKFMKSLDVIHQPVAEYDPNIARRVNRLFTAMRPEQPLWRANYFLYQDSDLHQPRLEGEGRSKGALRFVRVERQTLRKLPKSGAVVFGIHTFVAPLSSLTEPEHADLMKFSEERS